MVMIKKWSRRFSKCQNCGTNRFPHEASRLCIRCYTLVRRLEQVDGWNYDHYKADKWWPRDLTVQSSEEFDRIRSGVAKQIKERLSFLETRETKLQGPIYTILHLTK